MMLFPTIKPPTLEHQTQWASSSCEEALLAQEEGDFEEKCHEIRMANATLMPIGKINVDNDQDELEPDGEEDDADNVEEESEGEDFDQETG
ncbi:hypothetical protein KP509_10G008900 [Ceratopteris richardii]|uniref:Uncharacterized protein n=1 Tax=Ceratopteris richardii TaxID=49495 RepID=A0A8T2TYV5_CERRI|nr:hypothetical protein KP509_10G008900 [Ceratopteris richardii]